MKRRGFLGLLLAVPVAAKVAIEPKAEAHALPFANCAHTAFNCECGSAALPAMQFTADTDTGYYFEGTLGHYEGIRFVG